MHNSQGRTGPNEPNIQPCAKCSSFVLLKLKHFGIDGLIRAKEESHGNLIQSVARKHMVTQGQLC